MKHYIPILVLGSCGIVGMCLLVNCIAQLRREIVLKDQIIAVLVNGQAEIIEMNKDFYRKAMAAIDEHNAKFHPVNTNQP